jgi:hypothetical protein
MRSWLQLRTTGKRPWGGDFAAVFLEKEGPASFREAAARRTNGQVKKRGELPSPGLTEVAQFVI